MVNWRESLKKDGEANDVFEDILDLGFKQGKLILLTVTWPNIHTHRNGKYSYVVSHFDVNLLDVSDHAEIS